MKTLTDRGLRALLKKPGVHRVASGLYLRVRDTGAAFWALRYTINGKSREMGLGTFSHLSLAEATKLSHDLRLSLKRDGIDPIETRRIANERREGAAFRDVAENYIEGQRPKWKNAKHAEQWGNTLKHYAYPVLGDLDVAKITTEDVLTVLKPIWTQKHETATRLRQRIEAVMDAATARKLREGDNPARWKGHLDKLLAAIPKAQRIQHHPALPWKELPAFLSELRQSESMSARALVFTILTACRTAEVTGAKWAEIDLETKVWMIPAVRMKAKREHRVPLSSHAVKLLKSLPVVQGNEYVFQGIREKSPISNMAMLEQLKGLRPGYTVHGFRSTFRDWVADATSFSPELAEMALAHTIANQTEAAYRRGDLLERRRDLMQAWADYATGKGKVVKLSTVA